MEPSIRIPLPDMARGKKSKIHPFPFQIAVQTLEFMQGSLFFMLLGDIAAGEYMQQPDGIENLKRIFIERLDSAKTYDEGWVILGKYQAVFEKAPYQSALIAMNTHWDWYVRKLVDFILFARQDLNQPALEKKVRDQLKRFSSLSIIEQLNVIQVVAGINSMLGEGDKSELQEMALVRNLGLHNRWEIDKRYLEQSVRSELQVGELRIIEIDELKRWHQAFCGVVQATGREVALTFVSANDYPNIDG